jgi:hypothetical protein
MALVKVNRQIQLMHCGQNHVYYRYGSSDYQCTLFAINALEKELGRVKNSLVPYFRDKQDKNLFDSSKVEVHIV